MESHYIDFPDDQIYTLQSNEMNGNLGFHIAELLHNMFTFLSGSLEEKPSMNSPRKENERRIGVRQGRHRDRHINVRHLCGRYGGSRWGVRT